MPENNLLGNKYCELWRQYKGISYEKGNHFKTADLARVLDAVARVLAAVAKPILEKTTADQFYKFKYYTNLSLVIQKYNLINQKYKLKIKRQV